MDKNATLTTPALLLDVQFSIQANPQKRVRMALVGGGMLEGAWIESRVADGDLGTPDTFDLFDEKSGEVSVVSLPMDSVAGIGTVGPEPHDRTLLTSPVPPSRRDMTLRAMIFEWWTNPGQVATYSDMLEELNRMGDDAGGYSPSDRPLDLVHEGIKPLLDKALVNIATRKGLSLKRTYPVEVLISSVIAAGLCTEDHAEIQEMRRAHTGGTSDQLPPHLLGFITPRFEIARMYADGVSHSGYRPFIRRNEWRDRLIRFGLERHAESEG